MGDDERTPEEILDDLNDAEMFALRINAAMLKGMESDLHPDTMAKICINTARELYDHYGAGEEFGTFMSFVTSTGFEAAEIDEWLDDIEGKRSLDKGHDTGEDTSNG